MRVGDLVKNHEARIHGQILTSHRVFDVDRMRVPTRSRIGIEERNIVSAVKKSQTAQSADTGADNRYPLTHAAGFRLWFFQLPRKWTRALL